MPDTLVVSTPHYHTTSSEFDSGINKIYSIFHSLRVNEMSIKIAWKLTTEDLELDCITWPGPMPDANGQENRVNHCRLRSLGIIASQIFRLQVKSCLM